MKDLHLKLNKTVSLAVREDPSIDLTSIRVGKQRIARKNDGKLSALKTAILQSRNETVALAPERRAPEACESNGSPSETRKALNIPSNGYLPYDPVQAVDDLTYEVLRELSRLQAKGKDQPPEKRYKYKKFVVGFREVERALKRSELKGVVIATNLEEVDELTNMITSFRDDCAQREVPLVFALSRRRMGKALGKSMKQSLVGIWNLDGVHQSWKQILALVEPLEPKITQIPTT